ncbi:MAG: hypothetical protein PEPC_01759 [Peptostreptococcus russellii]
MEESTTKSATLLQSESSGHFFIRVIEENGGCFETADYNFYASEVKMAIRNYREQGYIVHNKLPVKKRIKFVQTPETNKYGKWVTEDGFVCFTDKRTTALRRYNNHLREKKSKVSPRNCNQQE